MQPLRISARLASTSSARSAVEKAIGNPPRASGKYGALTLRVLEKPRNRTVLQPFGTVESARVRRKLSPVTLGVGLNIASVSVVFRPVDLIFSIALSQAGVICVAQGPH